MAPGKDEKGEKPRQNDGRYKSEAGGLSPEDHRRPPKRDRSYPLRSYPFSDAAKILIQENRSFVTGVLSSSVSLVVVHPLDTLKTRMQANGTSSELKSLRDIRKTDGLRALYRGLVGPTLTYVGVRTIMFGVYPWMQFNVDDAIAKWTGRSILQEAKRPGSYPTFLSIGGMALTGAILGAGIAPIACPFELMKIGRQSAGASPGAVMDPKLVELFKKKGIFTCLFHTYRRIGIRGVYSGLSLHVVRDTITGAVFWGSYEGIKQVLSVAWGLQPDNKWAGACAGAACSALSFLASYPIDTVKVAYQRDCLHMSEASKKGLVRQAIKYRSMDSFIGWRVTVVRLCLNGFLQMGMFEWLRGYLRRLDIDPPKPKTKVDWDRPVYEDDR